MLSNKFTRPFLDALGISYISTDFKSAKEYHSIISGARVSFEYRISNSLVILTPKQQTRLLIQLLEIFKEYKYIYYIEEYSRTSIVDKDKYQLMLSLQDDFDIFLHIDEKAENRLLRYHEAVLLQNSCVSREYSIAQENVRNAYLEREGIEKAIPWILDRKEFIAQNSEWQAEERERKGLPPDTRTFVEKMEDVFYENLDTDDNSKEPDTSELPSAPIPWRYGLADFAETLYKLERKGAIDLKSYFEGGGKGAGLVRTISSLFAFPNDKSAATLNTYLSEIRKSLGRGPLDAGVLKAIGRIRGGKMDDVIPDEPEPNTP